MTRTEIRQKANSEMEKRRLRAEAEAEARTAEIYKKTPAGGGDTPNAGRNSFRAFSAYNQAGQ